MTFEEKNLLQIRRDVKKLTFLADMSIKGEGQNPCPLIFSTFFLIMSVKAHGTCPLRMYFFFTVPLRKSQKNTSNHTLQAIGPLKIFFCGFHRLRKDFSHSVRTIKKYLMYNLTPAFYVYIAIAMIIYISNIMTDIQPAK